MPTLPAASLVDVDGHAAEFVRAGTGTPTVVLINGSGGPLAGWMRVFDGIAARTTTLAYNRPGIGRSARPAKDQTGAEMVTSLRRLLTALQLTPPMCWWGTLSVDWSPSCSRGCIRRNWLASCCWKPRRRRT